MDKLITNYHVTVTKALLGSLIVGLGFFLATTYINPLISALAPFSMMIMSAIAFVVVYGPKHFLDLFSKPNDPKGNIKNFFKYFILTAVLGMSLGILLNLLFHNSLAANPEAGNLGVIILKLPFMLLGEELLSFFFLLVIANLVYKKTGNRPKAELVGIILSSIIFGLMHYTTYYNGNIMVTLLHVILVQGSARVAFNISGLRANSIWLPLLIHIVYDLIFLSFS
ncbi:type II CAAX prenyl endopeptidase Rce1 family protein [uncultured Vagococcus sp.]|uniref:CPBP family glutamic-type intramembrane protease n=1 Tax=uncultured Vagococcus sp. TaxID=189676 RepID=UPI0028D31A21|nr:CPBP family glutamic-type intramembrane protease [uncultured Vagococcus sp.]